MSIFIICSEIVAIYSRTLKCQWLYTFSEASGINFMNDEVFKNITCDKYSSRIGTRWAASTIIQHTNIQNAQQSILQGLIKSYYSGEGV